MQTNFRKEQIPWLMAGGRAVLGPVMVAGQASGWSGLTMAGLIVVALVSDIFDGVLARRLRSDTAGLRRFDSLADTVFYAGAAIALWMARPQVLRSHAGLLAGLIGLEAGRFCLEFAKFGKQASYHSYLAKAWGLTMAAALIAAFISPNGSVLIAVSLIVGIASNVEGVAMTLILPMWRRDVKDLGAAWRMRVAMQETHNRPRMTGSSASCIYKPLGAAVLAVCLMVAVPAHALDRGQVVYEGGTAKLAMDSMGSLDTGSPTDLIYRYKEANSAQGEIDIPYAKIRSVEARNDVVRHLGFLPALGAGLVAARQRRHTLTISYADATGTMQVATFELDAQDQLSMQQILRVRAPQSRSCTVTSYSTCAPNPVARPVAGQATK
jgi:phosphatidylglycerophosphate synthase